MSSDGTFNSFSTTNKSNLGTKEFLESNSLVAKFAFLLLVIIGFVFLLRIGISIIGRFTKPDESPRLIDGMVDASQMLIFEQDPSSNSAVTIYRSVNAEKGIEFTWNIWVYINSIYDSGKTGSFKHIFSKGNSDLQENGLIFPNNAPGLYIAPNKNALVLIMNTFHVINEEIIIPNIPINNWVNVIIRCQNTTLDVYINGTITRSINLIGVPRQNYGNVYVGMNGGFDGYISNLWYYNYALGTSAIQNLVKNGPNTKMVDGTGNIDNNLFNYLSLRWYFRGFNDEYQIK